MCEITSRLFVAGVFKIATFMFAFVPHTIAPPTLISNAHTESFVQPICNHWTSMQVAQSRFPGCCGVDRFECRFKNGTYERCISLQEFHDGVLNCDDGSDEACFPGQIHCGKFCADLIHLGECLRNPHCNASDSTPPAVIIGVEPPSFCGSINRTLCGSLAAISCRGYGDCIYGTSLMDGHRDCFDGSDEDPLYASLFKSIGAGPVLPVQSDELSKSMFNASADKSHVPLEDRGGFIPQIVAQTIQPILPGPFQNLFIGNSSQTGFGDESNLSHPKEHLTPVVNAHDSISDDLHLKELFDEPFRLTHDIANANNAVGIGIGVGQLTVPKANVIRPANDHSQEKYVPPVPQQNNLRFYSRDPAHGGVLPSHSVSTARFGDEPETTTTQSSTVPQSDVTARRVDFGRYYLWPNQDGWVVFPPGGEPQGLFHERMPSQENGVFVIKSALPKSSEKTSHGGQLGNGKLQLEGGRQPDSIYLVAEPEKTPAFQTGEQITPAITEPTTIVDISTATDENLHLERIIPENINDFRPVKPIYVPPIRPGTFSEERIVGGAVLPLPPSRPRVLITTPCPPTTFHSEMENTEELPEMEKMAESSPIMPINAPRMPAQGTTDAAVFVETSTIKLAILPVASTSTTETETTTIYSTTTILSRSTVPEAEEFDVVPSTTSFVAAGTNISAESDLDVFSELPINVTSENCTDSTISNLKITTASTVRTVVESGTTSAERRPIGPTVPEAEREDQFSGERKLAAITPQETATPTMIPFLSHQWRTTSIAKTSNISDLPPKLSAFKESTTKEPIGAAMTLSEIDLFNGFVAPIMPVVAPVLPATHPIAYDTTLSTQPRPTVSYFSTISRQQQINKITFHLTTIETATVKQIINRTDASADNKHGPFTGVSQVYKNINESHVNITESPSASTDGYDRMINMTSVVYEENNGSIGTTAEWSNANVTRTISNVTNTNWTAGTHKINDNETMFAGLRPTNRTQFSEKSSVSITSTAAQTSISSAGAMVEWAQTGVDAARVNATEEELSSLNCTQRNRELARRLAPSPMCDCAPGQLRDTHGVCRRTDVATFRARLTRFCGARAHLDALTGDAQAAVVFSKLAAMLPNVSLCVRQSAGALVIMNAQCGSSCTFSDLQHEYFTKHAVLSEVDLKIAELEESACYRSTLNDCDKRVSECVPFGLHYVCECLPDVQANATRDANGETRCQDASWRYTCIQIFGICILVWLVALLLLCMIVPLLFFLWTNFCDSGARFWDDLQDKFNEGKRPRRLPVSEYSAYAAIYRLMRTVSNLVDEEKLKTRRVSDDGGVISLQPPRTTDRISEGDEEEEDVGKWLEHPEEDEREKGLDHKEQNNVELDQLPTGPSYLSPRAGESIKEEDKWRKSAATSGDESEIVPIRRASVTSKSSVTDTLWDSYRSNTPFMPPPLRLHDRQDSSDSMDKLIQQREERRRARQARRLAENIASAPKGNDAERLAKKPPTPSVLAEAARKAEAEIKREIEGVMPPRVNEKPAHYRQLPTAAPATPPSSQTAGAPLAFRAVRRRSSSQLSDTSTRASIRSYTESERRGPVRRQHSYNGGSDVDNAAKRAIRRASGGGDNVTEKRRANRQLSENGNIPPTLRRRLSDGIEDEAVRPRHNHLIKRTSRATLELSEHRALRRRAIYGAGATGSTSSKSSTAVATAAAGPVSSASTTPVGSVSSGALPPIHPGRRPLVAKMLPPSPVDSALPLVTRKDSNRASRRNTLRHESGSAKSPSLSPQMSLVHTDRPDGKGTIEPARRRILPQSTPTTSKTQRQRDLRTRRRDTHVPTQNESALASLAHLPISLSYPSLKETYEKRRSAEVAGDDGDATQIPLDIDLDLPGPYVRPAKTRPIKSPSRPGDSAKLRTSQSSSTVARKIANRQAMSPHQSPASARSSARSEEMTASARERVARLQQQFEERVHSGCLKDRPAWDTSPMRPGEAERASLTSGGVGGPLARFSGSQLSLTGLEIRRTRSSSGEFSAAVRGRNVVPRGYRRRVAPLGQRRVVTFDEKSIEIGERSRSMLDVPIARVSRRASATIKGMLPSPSRMSRAELIEDESKREAIRRTNAFSISDTQKDAWMARFQGTIDAKSWLDYD